MPRGRRATTKALAVALALVAFAGQLAGFAHLVAVEHVRCEHGELVEVSRRQLPSSAGAVARSTVDSVGSASDVATHGHEHCLLGPTRRDHLALHAYHASAAGRAPELRCDLGPAACAVAPPIPIIVLAPKNSPPLA